MVAKQARVPPGTLPDLRGIQRPPHAAAPSRTVCSSAGAHFLPPCITTSTATYFKRQTPPNASRCTKGKVSYYRLWDTKSPQLGYWCLSKKKKKNYQGSSSATLPLNDNLIKEKNLISHSMIVPMQIHMSFFFPHCNSWKWKNVTFFKWEMLRSVF